MTARQLGLAQAEAEQIAATFYHQFFVAGGSIVWFILLPMSIITVYLAIDLLITTRRKRLLPEGLSSEIATSALRHGLNTLPARLSGRTDLISRAILRAIEQARQMGGSDDSIRQFAAEALQERGMQLMRKVQWCQVLGTVGPMVGLFGTVYGMICAFNLLGQNPEGPRFEMLADSISVTLVTTYWGLLVAIPALSFYSFFLMRIEVLLSEAAMETEAILARILKDGGKAFIESAVQPAAPKEPNAQTAENNR
ncbi:MAG: MotA/TolQ/ExbB proton channel family protein [Planctomycetales bacterium]|nr:MotA/TolQ/ExbB proton channel family protein [Planctomycetales bacterium]